MSSKLTILFYGKTSKTTKEGLLPIYLRVTINGKRFEVSTGRYLDASRWSVASGRAKGNAEEARSLNATWVRCGQRPMNASGQSFQTNCPETSKPSVKNGAEKRKNRQK